MLTIFSDGAVEPCAPANGWAVCAFVVFKGVVSGKRDSSRPDPVYAQHGYIGRFKEGQTAPISEYRAVIAALKWVLKNAPTDKVELRTDAQLIERQLNGFYQCNAPTLLKYCVEGQKLLLELPNARVVWVPREENDVADALTRIALRKIKEGK